MKTQNQQFPLLWHSFSIVAALLLFSVAPNSMISAQAAENLYLPVVTNALINQDGCCLNEQEAQLAELLRSDPGQKRATLICNPLLAQVAHERAADMATRAYVAHVNPDGNGPNYLVTQAGYVLPGSYSTARTANNIESLAAGNDSATAVWTGLLKSTPHRVHLLGTDKFYATQIEYGVGYAYQVDSPFDHYWVVITAEPGP